MVEVLRETDDYVVVNKPAGLLVHPDGTSEEETLVDWVLSRYPHVKNVGEEQRLRTGEVVLRPGIVHRLDRDTSGVLVIAKTQETYEHLKTEFGKRQVKKVYMAYVYGTPRESRGLIDAPIGKSRQDFRQWSAESGARGKVREARTRYVVEVSGGGASRVSLFPETGRTHQLRVHMKKIGHPIICDTLYAPGRECLLGFSRLALHAHRLSFVDRNENIIETEAPLPSDFLVAEKQQNLE